MLRNQGLLLLISLTFVYHQTNRSLFSLRPTTVFPPYPLGVNATEITAIGGGTI
jgi:hypothetical protein